MLGVFINNDAFSPDHSGIAAGQLLKPERLIVLLIVIALMKDREVLILLLDTVFVDNDRVCRDLHGFTVVILVNDLVSVLVFFNTVSSDKYSTALKEEDAVLPFMLIDRKPENSQSHCGGEISCFSLVRIGKCFLQFVPDPHHFCFLIYLIALENLNEVVIQWNIPFAGSVCTYYELFNRHIELMREAAVADKHALPLTGAFLCF